MHTINGHDITLTRGDTLMLQLVLKRGDEDYQPSEGDVIRFALKRFYRDPDTAVKIVKNIPTDTLVLELKPSDTKTLAMGTTYVYDIQITDADGNVDTFASGNFTIGQEVL